MSEDLISTARRGNTHIKAHEDIMKLRGAVGQLGVARHSEVVSMAYLFITNCEFPLCLLVGFGKGF